MLAYSPLVKYVAGRMSSGLPAHVEEADLISYGLLGLISAIERFEPAREIRFETFAITRIKGSIIDELRSLDWVPRSVRAKAREIERANAKLEHKLHRAPTDQEMAAELDVGSRSSRSRWCGSPTRPWSRWTSCGPSPTRRATRCRCWTRSRTRRAADPAQEMDLTDMKDRLADSIARLPEREKLVVALYYYENLTLREIGEVLGVTESRVSQLHTKAVLRLKSRLQGDSAHRSPLARWRDPSDRRSDDELRRRLRQQAAVAELGREALAGADVDALAGSAVEMIAVELGVPVAVLVSPGPGGYPLRFRAQVGPPGRARGPGQAAADRPRPADLHAAPGRRGGLARAGGRDALHPVAGAGRLGACAAPPACPWACTAARSASWPRAAGAQDDFSDDDVNFLQGMANTLAVAVDRERAADERERERERLEEALRRASENEARFRELADAAPVYIWTADADGLVDFINRGWLEYTGRTMEEELGDSWALGVHPDDTRGRDRQLVARLPAAGAVGARVPAARRATASTAGSWTAACRGSRTTGWWATWAPPPTSTSARRSSASSARPTSATTRWPRRSSARCCPRACPGSRALQLDARYLPASASAAIGGDWYDAVELEDGRVAVVVGDVVGHGLRAAVVMGQLRTAFRAYALLGTSPADTLARLNRLLMKEGARADGHRALPAAGPRHGPALVRQRRAPARPGDRPRRRAALPRGRALRAAGHVRHRLPRGRGHDRARLDRVPVHRRAGRAARHRAGRPAGPAGHRGRHRRTASWATSATRSWAGCWAASAPATTWRCWRCDPSRPPPARWSCGCRPTPPRWPSCASGSGASWTLPAPTSRRASRSRWPSPRPR